MSQHLHTTHVEGCYRCDLSLDEVEAIRREEAEDDAILADILERRHLWTQLPYEERPHCWRVGENILTCEGIDHSGLPVSDAEAATLRRILEGGA